MVRAQLGQSMSKKPRLCIIWHSRTGAVRTLVSAMMQAASEYNVETLVIPAASAVATDILLADALIFACPENLALMTGTMKEFFDLNYYPLLGKVNGKSYACVIAAGSDGTGAMRQIERIATGLRLKKVAETVLVITNAQTPETIQANKVLSEAQLAPAIELARTLAAGLELGIF